MYYLKIRVVSARYKKAEPLTYSHTEALKNGSIVAIPLQRTTALGIVMATVRAPKFKTKNIVSVISEKELPDKLIQLADWVDDYYVAAPGTAIQLLLPSAIGTTGKSSTSAHTDKETATEPMPNLTKKQHELVEAIRTSNETSFLLHGETATGKTRMYAELLKETLSKNRSAIVIVPEIGLSSQLLLYFRKHFGDIVHLYHSDIGVKQRRETWHALHNSTTPTIVIGPRSALFSPTHNIGLIIIDEAHDQALKQEQSPRYVATKVAAKLAHLTDSKLILGSATPLVTDFYAFDQKKLPILRITSPAIESKHTVRHQIVDQKDKNSFTKSAHLSNQLIHEITTALQANEQTLLFLNRRGTARSIACHDCGWRATCTNCDLPMTYHADIHKLLCHTCGLTQKSILQCPDCGSGDILFKAAGTKAVETEVKRLFPEASIMRFDGDNKKSERLETHYKSIHDNKVQIIIGTQLITKGLDLPHLGVVGIVSADTALAFPDYGSEEKTYQMIQQVYGRVGRGHRDGRLVVQTYYPDSKTLASALQKKYADFYESELTQRERYSFPPFTYTAKLTFRHKKADTADKEASHLIELLTAYKHAVEIIGPSPSFHERSGGLFGRQIILKAKNRDSLCKVTRSVPDTWTKDIDPLTLL